eukprot:4098120-Amphidinium_carterae.1
MHPLASALSRTKVWLVISSHPPTPVCHGILYNTASVVAMPFGQRARSMSKGHIIVGAAVARLVHTFGL